VISARAVVDALSDAVWRTSDLAPAVLFGATVAEYVFPPVPGDAIVLLGAWYAVEGALSWPVTFLSVTAGAIAGAWIDYRIGAAVGLRLDRRAAERSPRWEVRFARFEASYRRWGVWLLLANRFLPGVRAFLFYAAGASGLPLWKVLLCGGISSAVWNAVLLGAGALAVENVDELVDLFERYTRVAWVALAAIALVLVAAAVVRRRLAARAARRGERP
jgi:membrane-associated protein